MKAAEIVLALELLVLLMMAAVLLFRFYGKREWRDRLAHMRHHLLDGHGHGHGS